MISAIPPGTYDLKAELTGFGTVERKGIVVQVGSANRIALTLEVGQPARDGRGHGRLAADPDRKRGDQHGDREPRDRRAAAQRPQLPAARVIDSRRDDQRALVEPGQAAHGRPAQQLRAERRRPAHPLQPLLARRRREHRPELQLLHAAAVGRRAGGVQRRVRPVRRRVRPRHRAGQRLDQVGIEQVSRHGVRVPAQLLARRQELLRPAGSADPAVQAQPVRVHGRRAGGPAEDRRRPEQAVLHVQLGRAAREQVADADAVAAADARGARAISPGCAMPAAT